MTESPEGQLRYAERVLPGLKDLTRSVLAISETTTGFLDFDPREGVLDTSARRRHMVALYAAAQHEHLQSVLALVNAGQHRDAWLIARTMIEGLVQLVWAVEYQPDGPSDWFWFNAIEDWRQLRKNKERGRPVSAEEEKQNAKWVAECGYRYFTPEAEKAQKKGKAMPDDPYRHKWHHVSVWQMFKDIKVSRSYQSVYGPASEWVHWNPRALLRTAVQPDGNISRSIHDPLAEARALEVAISSMLDTLTILSRTLGVTFQDPLEEAGARLRETMRPPD